VAGVDCQLSRRLDRPVCPPARRRPPHPLARPGLRRHRRPNAALARRRAAGRRAGGSSRPPGYSAARHGAARRHPWRPRRAALLGALSLPLLYGAALLLGVADTLAETAPEALLPLLVAPAHLERANTHLAGAQQVIEAVSLPLGGALATAGLALAIGAGGLCYGVALAALVLLRGAAPGADTAERGRIVADVVAGVRVLWRHAALRWIGLMAGVINACWSAWLAVLVLYAVAPGPLRLSAAQYGLLLAGSGIGGLVGAAVLAPSSGCGDGAGRSASISVPIASCSWLRPSRPTHG
jgi:hypothetical protein